MAEPLLGTSELAEEFGVPIKTIYQWRWKGTAPRAIKVGRYVKYRRSDVERWLDEQARAAG
jgi:excisionase family DNA binding protein